MKLPDFKAPKLPLAWIAGTFIPPTLVVILPNLFTSEEIPFTTLLIIALVLFSVLLLISCFSLVVQIYSVAFEVQGLKLQLYVLEDRAKSIEQKADKFADSLSSHPDQTGSNK